jgi:ABC-type sugar transport system ATPase subunit
MLYVTHDQSEAATIAEQTIFLDRGRIQLQNAKGV